MIDMIDLVQAEQACHDAEKMLCNGSLGMKPFADGSDKFKQSKESGDTQQNTVKHESDGPIGVITQQSSVNNETKGGQKKAGLLYKSALGRKDDAKWKRQATIELMGATQKNRNAKLQGSGLA